MHAHSDSHTPVPWVGYNVVAFPLAAGVFFPFTLSPEVAALSMSGSSVIVAVNALMLRRVRLQGGAKSNKACRPRRMHPALPDACPFPE